MGTRIYWLLLGVAISASPLRSEQQSSSPAQQTPAVTAQDLIAVPNRPTFATTAESVQRGVFEIEYGLEAASRHQNINGLLKWGVLENLELRFANNPIQRNSGVTGTGDSGAGFKYKMFRQTKKLPTFSIVYTAGIPTAPASRGIGAMGHSVQLLASKDFGKHHFDVNEGVQFVGRPGGSGLRGIFCCVRQLASVYVHGGFDVRSCRPVPLALTSLGTIHQRSMHSLRFHWSSCG
jgi:hypothetical protein